MSRYTRGLPLSDAIEHDVARMRRERRWAWVRRTVRRLTRRRDLAVIAAEVLFALCIAAELALALWRSL